MRRYPAATFSLIFGEPRIETDLVPVNVLTHLQKFSRAGLLAHLTWFYFLPVPTFHAWFFWKKQEFIYDKALGDLWRPGTERGIYFRTPGLRWDIDLGMKWTWGYIGGHWD